MIYGGGGGEKSMKEVVSVKEGIISGAICAVYIINGLVCGLTGYVFPAGKQEVWDRCKSVERDSNGRE
jgi:hypothetical protein